MNVLHDALFEIEIDWHISIHRPSVSLFLLDLHPLKNNNYTKLVSWLVKSIQKTTHEVQDGEVTDFCREEKTVMLIDETQYEEVYFALKFTVNSSRAF